MKAPIGNVFQWVNVEVYYTCARAGCRSRSQERLDRLRSDLVHRWGPVGRVPCKSQLEIPPLSFARTRLILLLARVSPRKASYWSINPHRAGGGGRLGFLRYLKNGARCCFWHRLLYVFSAYVVKILAPGHQRSGQQVKLSDPTSEKIKHAPWRMFEHFEAFGICEG